MSFVPTLSRNIPLLKWYNFLGSLCFYAAVMLIYFVQVTHSYALAASVFSITMLAATFFEIPTGVFSDWFGRKGVLILGAFFALASLTFYAFASGFWMLVIGGILDGLSHALGSGNNDALLHDTLKELGREGEYASNRGQIGFWGQTALSIAVLAGSLFVGISLSLVFKLSLVPLVLALVLGFLIKEPSVKGSVRSNVYGHLGGALKVIRDNSSLRLLATAQSLESAYWNVKAALMPAFFLMFWPLWAIGVARALAHAASALGMKAVGYFNQRYEARKIALYSNGSLFGIGIFLLALPSFFSPLIHSLSIFLVGLTSTVENAMTQKEFTDAHRATLGSIISFASTLLGAALAFIVGIFADRIGLIPALLFLQAFLIPVIFIYWKLGRLSKELDFIKKL